MSQLGHSRLLAALEPLGQGRAQRARKQRVPLGIAPQVHGAHRRHLPAADAPGEPHALVLAARGVGERFETRGRRPQHDRDPEQLGAPHRGVAAVVAQLLALLVGRLMLLVDDDELELWQRREHRRARAHHDIERPAARELPVATALADAQVGMEHAHAPAEAGAKRRHHLGPERDLGHQHQRLPARLARRVRGAQVDLGLAARGDAVEQQRGEAAARDGRLDLERRTTLFGREPVRLGQRQRHDRVLDRLEARPAAGETLEPARKGRGQHLPQRRQVVLRDPARQLEQVRGHERWREHGTQGLDALERGRGLQLDQESAPRAAAKRHLDLHAGQRTGSERLGDAVGEGLPDGKGKRDLGEGHAPTLPAPQPGDGTGAITAGPRSGRRLGIRRAPIRARRS